MDQETFNLSIRKFLKMVGVNSQREIEQAVGKALAGDVTLSFPVKGVHCEIVIPAAHVTSRG